MSTDQPTPDQAYRFCRNVTRRRARNFYYGLKLTPQPQRSALYAVYAWMRRADDLVDNAPKITDDLRREIAAFRITTDEALSGRITGNEPLWWVVETDHPDCPVLPLRIRHGCTALIADTAVEQRGWLFYVYMVNAGSVTAGTSVDLDVDVRRLYERPSCGINAVESLTPDATAEFLGMLEPPGESSTVRFRFTPRAGTSGLMYAMVDFKSLTGDKAIAVIARVMP